MTATAERMTTVSVADRGPCVCRVLLVDDDPRVRESVAPVLERWGCTVVGILDSADAIVHAVIRQRPDVVVLDIDMPGRSPLHAIEDLRYRGSRAKVLVLSGLADGPTVRACLDAGAWGYVHKDDAPEALREGLAALLRGQKYFSPRVAPAAPAAR